MNFLRRLALQKKKKIDDSSRLDVVEIARVPDILPSLFPSWSGQGLVSTPVLQTFLHVSVLLNHLQGALILCLLELQNFAIIVIIIIIIVISFMQGIYTYIPETNYIPREYSVAAVLLLLFMVLISLVPVLNLLYFYISTFRNMCAVPNIAVFCSSLTAFFPTYQL